MRVRREWGVPVEYKEWWVEVNDITTERILLLRMRNIGEGGWMNIGVSKSPFENRIAICDKCPRIASRLSLSFGSLASTWMIPPSSFSKKWCIVLFWSKPFFIDLPYTQVFWRGANRSSFSSHSSFIPYQPGFCNPLFERKRGLCHHEEWSGTGNIAQQEKGFFRPVWVLIWL